MDTTTTTPHNNNDKTKRNGTKRIRQFDKDRDGQLSLERVDAIIERNFPELKARATDHAFPKPYECCLEVSCWPRAAPRTSVCISSGRVRHAAAPAFVSQTTTQPHALERKSPTAHTADFTNTRFEWGNTCATAATVATAATTAPLSHRRRHTTHAPPPPPPPPRSRPAQALEDGVPLTNAYKFADNDCDGSLTRLEFMLMLRSLVFYTDLSKNFGGEHGSAQSSIDLDQDGEIDVDEVRAARVTAIAVCPSVSYGEMDRSNVRRSRHATTIERASKGWPQTIDLAVGRSRAEQTDDSSFVRVTLIARHRR